MDRGGCRDRPSVDHVPTQWSKSGEYTVLTATALAFYDLLDKCVEFSSAMVLN